MIGYFCFNLALRTIKFCSVLFLFSVFTGAWRSVPQTDVHRNCYTLLHRRSAIVAHSLAIIHPINVNVNVNLYSASSQKAPLMRSMCRVLFKKKRLQCTTKTVNLHVRLTQIVLEQVPCRWSSDSEGATAVRIELKPWNKE